MEKPEGKDFKLKPGAGCYDYGWRHIKRHTCSSRQVCKKWERLPRSCLFLSFYLINFISFHFTFTKSKRVKVPNIRNLISRLVGHFSFSSLSYYYFKYMGIILVRDSKKIRWISKMKEISRRCCFNLETGIVPFLSFFLLEFLISKYFFFFN